MKIQCSKKYLHGKTHNQNEAAIGMVWECIPKDIFVGGEILDFSLLNATSHFNIGAKTVTQLLEALKTSQGYTEEGSKYLDLNCVCGAEYKES